MLGKVTGYFEKKSVVSQMEYGSYSVRMNHETHLREHRQFETPNECIEELLYMTKRSI